MAGQSATNPVEKPEITVEEVNRVLEIGHLLRSVLTPEELEQLQEIQNSNWDRLEIGNTGVTWRLSGFLLAFQEAILRRLSWANEA